MSAINTIDAIEALGKAGYYNLRIKTLRTILLLYELGSLTKQEITEIAGLKQSEVLNQLHSLSGMQVVMGTGNGMRWSPFVYKLNPDIRNIIGSVYEKRDESTA